MGRSPRNRRELMAMTGKRLLFTCTALENAVLVASVLPPAEPTPTELREEKKMSATVHASFE